MKRLIPLVGLWVFAMGFVWATDPFPVGYDVAFHIRYLQDYSEAWRENPFRLPDWDPRPYGGRGSAAFRFYAPAVYLLGSVFMFLGFTVTGALKAVLGVYTAVGILGMHFWLRTVLPASLVLTGAGLFVICPMFSAHLFQMFFFQNICANLLLPWVLGGWTGASANRRGLLIAALGLSAMGYTHLPATLMAGYILAVLALIDAIGTRSFRPVMRLIWITTFCGALISPYSLPAMNGISEVSFYRLETMVPWVRQDFLDDPLRFSPDTELWDSIRGVFRLAMVGALVPFLIGGVFSRWGVRRFRATTPFSVAAGVFGFMTIRWSMWLWYLLPGLKVLQFPWRFAWPTYILMIPAMALAPGGGFPSGGRMGRAAGKTLRVLGILGFLGLLSLNMAIQYYRKPVSDMKSITSIAFYYPPEYLPESCHEADPKPLAGEVRGISLPSGAGRITASRHWSDVSEIQGEVGAASAGEPVLLEILTHWDPCWAATVNGQPVNPVCLKRCGTMGIPLGAGSFQLRLFRRPPPERWWAILLALVVPGVMIGFLRRYPA